MAYMSGATWNCAQTYTDLLNPVKDSDLLSPEKDAGFRDLLASTNLTDIGRDVLANTTETGSQMWAGVSSVVSSAAGSVADWGGKLMGMGAGGE
jgi:hypothetical protein